MEAATGGTPDAAPLATLSALVAAATLLFIGLLGLIQVRRTMVPLERLIAGTRRLSEHDYSARVALRPGDEFGELAHSFNHMAERIDHQMQALARAVVDRSRDPQRARTSLASCSGSPIASNKWCPVPPLASSNSTAPRDSLARVHSAPAPPCPSSACHGPMRSVWRRCRSRKPSCATTPRMAARPHDGGRRAAVGPLCQVRRRVAGDAGDRRRRSRDRRQPTRQREIAELCNRVSVTLASADRERRLLERATHDNLTGLANRAGLYESIDAQLAEDLPAPFSVLFVDLDRFKEVNDSMGHQIGDELLRAVAKRLQQRVPAGTLVARPGGDEFVLVVRGPRAGADDLARALCSELGQPFDLGGRTALVGAQHRHGASPGARLELVGPDAPCRHGDVQRQGARRRRGGMVRAGARCPGRRTRRAAGRSAACTGARRTGAALSAAHSHPQRQGDQCRGIAALATSRARPRAGAHVHQAAGGDRPDRRRGPLGHRASCSPTRAVASGRHGAGIDCRQSVDAAAACSESARKRGGNPRAPRPARPTISNWKSPSRSSWATRRRRSARCGSFTTAVSASRWTTSAPATRRCRTCTSCQSGSSRWTAASSSNSVSATVRWP